MRSLTTAMRMIGSASASLLTMRGSSTSSGRRPRTRPTASRMSLAASSILRPLTNSTVVRLRPVRLCEEIVLTPLTPAMAPSMTSVMSASMISGAAPV
jgi:hypothetical protein